MPNNLQDQIDAAIFTAWREKHGNININMEILPPITPLYKEGFKEGVAFAMNNPELRKE